MPCISLFAYIYSRPVHPLPNALHECSFALPGGSSGESFGQSGGDGLVGHSVSSPMLLQHSADGATLSLLPSWDTPRAETARKVNTCRGTAIPMPTVMT